MIARESWSEKELTKAAKQQLHHSEKVSINPLGLSAWAARAGFTYEVEETNKMDLTLHDTDGKEHKITIEGDKTS
jgi:hypothetical protein